MLSVKTFVKGGFALSFVADLWNNENTKMKMQTKAILKTTICFFCFFSCLYYFLIPQHYYKLNFLSTRATKSCSGFCHVRVFTHLSVAKKQENPTMDMAKIQIKSERLTPFGVLFSIMEQFDSTHYHL